MQAVRRSLLIAALALLAPLAAVPAAASPGPVAPVTAADRTIGRPDAPVTVIEYASFACPSCADWHRFVWPLFKQRLVDTGQVRFVFRNLPTQPEQISLPAAALARCAAPERFFEVTSILMAGQAAVLRGGDRADWYAPAIAASGRTQAQIEACATTPETRAAINRDIETAHAADAHHTPSFFVNGRPVADRSLGGLEIAVRAALAER
ncbi:MAG: thioredoxin domain-containing protein [Brevundimonas sp.]|uniref:thioredoxin domain-containing protein n=1 Tax=Brevundimonas sp. TaxID=1871086 RepID=UPI001805947D|nr:thioredoxin domain-containing protein [Brevundimonas sp.]MBA4803944.1 thioredoxin domain-containing protein [Brevundimonas sp.]